MNLDSDLQRILNTNAKVYNSQTKRQGKVILVTDDLVSVDYGNKAKSDTEDYDIDDFKQMLVDDVIVANHRLTMGSRDNFKVKPRVKPQNDIRNTPSGVEVTKFNKEAVRESLQQSAQPVNMTPDVKVESEPDLVTISGKFTPSPYSKPQPDITNRQPAEVGYINFTTGEFSTEHEKGFTKVEFRKVLEEVVLRLTSDEIEKLKELGLV